MGLEEIIPAIFLILVLVLILPGFISSNSKSKQFFKNLYKIGYRYFSIKKRNLRDKKIIKSFQQRYLPNSVTGKIDEKTLKISYFLAD